MATVRETPDWLDELLDRYDLTIEEYYASYVLSRQDFWSLFWNDEITGDMAQDLDFLFEEEPPEEESSDGY